ncbi:DUF3368 domain-containing protein [Almyronema epifaneia]|uniref:DUF3368 domain-containing protein n=1 Tax=Almyronema epifaneia S1 TaxID=2991925 RepID=A0ABW6IED9_9CYAN
MPEPLVIVNTSPLLYLYQAGYLALLKQLYGKVITPMAVKKELDAGQQQGIQVPDLSQLEWLKVVTAQSSALVPVVTDLGAGETEVLALCLENPNSLMILDDQLARRMANIYQLKYTGTLGVLIKAKQAGYLESIAPVITKFQSLGMWLSANIMSEVLNLAGEAD